MQASSSSSKESSILEAIDDSDTRAILQVSVDDVNRVLAWRTALEQSVEECTAEQPEMRLYEAQQADYIIYKQKL